MISIGLAASGLSAYSAAILSMIRILQMLRKPSVERPDVALLFVDYVFVRSGQIQEEVTE